MKIDLDALERAALAISRDTWKVQCPNAGGHGYEVASSSGLEQICADVTLPRAEFIAAANPATILELIRRLRDAESSLPDVSKIDATPGDTVVVTFLKERPPCQRNTSRASRARFLMGSGCCSCLVRSIFQFGVFEAA